MLQRGSSATERHGDLLPKGADLQNLKRKAQAQAQEAIPHGAEAAPHGRCCYTIRSSMPQALPRTKATRVHRWQGGRWDRRVNWRHYRQLPVRQHHKITSLGGPAPGQLRIIGSAFTISSTPAFFIIKTRRQLRRTRTLMERSLAQQPGPATPFPAIKRLVGPTGHHFVRDGIRLKQAEERVPRNSRLSRSSAKSPSVAAFFTRQCPVSCGIARALPPPPSTQTSRRQQTSSARPPESGPVRTLGPPWLCVAPRQPTVK